MAEIEASESKRPPLFSTKALVLLIVPLVIERFLDITVGMADTVMVASLGESAVSAVSLVDNISTLVLQILAALATGGTVIISQYLGRDELRNARKASRQLLYTAFLFALLLTAFALPLRRQLLGFLFGRVETDVMEQAVSYFFITCLSYPFVSIFNSCAALFRSMGNSRLSMYASLFMNLLNVVGNALLIFVFGMGVEGAAIATLFSRIVASIIMLFLLRDPRNVIFIDHIFHFFIDKKMVKNILKVGIPNGLENGIFQVGKLAVQSLVSTFGTAAIAANTVSTRIGELICIPGSAISLAIIMVIGQCMGAGEHEQAKYYTKKLMGYIYIAMVFFSAVVFLVARPVTHIFNLSTEATNFAIQLLRVHVVMTSLLWPLSFPFANVLRAAGDVRFTMTVSIASMMLARVGISYFLAYALNLGLYSVWVAMYADWIIRSTLFFARYKSGKWMNIQVI